MSKRIPQNLWPMSIAMQALTLSDTEEKLKLMAKLIKATGGTGWMHESFDMSDPMVLLGATRCLRSLP